MGKIITFLLSCAIVWGSIETSSGQNISPQQKMRIEQQIDSIFHDNIKAAERLDYDKLTLSVDDKHRAGFISNGTYYPEYDSLIHIVKERSLRIAKQTITIRNEKITVLSDRIVLLTATGETNVEVVNSSAFSAKFFWTFVYEKSGNGWKVIQSHQSGTR